jgi:mutator protein MutT
MCYPVSIKGVILKNDRVLLVKNTRNEWELPGGRIELGETPGQCLKREIYEELKLHVEIGKIIDAKLFEVIPGCFVFLTAFLCEMTGDHESIEISHEHTEYQWIKIKDLPRINIPDVYIQTIKTVVDDFDKSSG